MLNREDIKWFVIHTRPHQENKVKAMLDTEQSKRPNILETYCPTNKILRMQKGKKIEETPLFASRVFILTTQKDATLFLTEKYPEGYLEYDKTQKKVMTIPELQMLFFMDFNEHYPEQVLVLERPYSDYAFNPKNEESNEIIKVMDGPFAGKTGYLIRFRRERRLVFQMEDMAISIPDIWDYHLTRLHNSTGDRQSKHTQKSRSIDFLTGMLQGCGFQDNLPRAFSKILKTLAEKPSLNLLMQQIKQEEEDACYQELSNKLQKLTPNEASTLISLASYTKEHPEVAEVCRTLSLRPFLTPTIGITPTADKEYAILEHKKFVEYIHPTSMIEDTYFSDQDKDMLVTVCYYAHIGILQKKNGNIMVFANWDKILREYFYLVGEAKEKQLETFSKYSPILHQVLTGQSVVKVEKDLLLDNGNIHALSIHTKLTSASNVPFWEQESVKKAIQLLTDTCKNICMEINTSTHLANWRKYLRSIWLHY